MSYLVYALVASLIFGAVSFLDPRKKKTSERCWATFAATAGFFALALGLALRAAGDTGIHYHRRSGRSYSWFQDTAVGVIFLFMGVRIQCLRANDQKGP